MYINVGKLLSILLILVAILIILFGVVTFAFSQNATEQSSGTLAAIFGLLLLWFTMWLGRSKR